MIQLSKRTIFSVAVFATGLVLTIIAVQLEPVKLFITRIDSTGIVGVFIGGILYAFSFTSSLATVLFLNMPDQLHPLLVGIIGGLGATVYDITVFLFVRRQADHGFLQAAYNAMQQRRRIPNWLSLIIGIAILGSPLPDELAAGFLGFMKLSIKKFIVVSFIANAIGLYFITALL
ncbi:MAG: hypothetical protein V1916_02540 [Patescibacteria group bacterium]